MNNFINLQQWLLREEGPGAPAGQPPAMQPGAPGDPMGQAGFPPAGQTDPNVAAPGGGYASQVQQEPAAPDVPEEDHEVHFEEWRNRYFKESVKGNTNVLIDLINQVRDRDLQAGQRRFVEDNLQVQFLRQQSNIMQASRDIRKAVNEQLDRNSPATTLVRHIDEALQKQRMLVDVFIKLTGYYGMKGDIHRKYLAALLGGVQVGTGIDAADVVLNDNEYSVNLSTRMSREFGNFDLGSWSLEVGDAHRFLSVPEVKRLDHGSPDEREVLRQRVVMDSICSRFDKRGFLLTSVGDDGTVYNIGWDVSTCLKAAYVTGKLVVKEKESESSEVMFDPDGGAVPIMDVDIRYAKDTGERDADGKRKKRELPFVERRNGVLFLVASRDLLHEAATNLQGLVVRELPYQGNPSDLTVLARCVYSAAEMVSRQC